MTAVSVLSAAVWLGSYWPATTIAATPRQAQPVEWSIPAGRLDQALQQLASQAGVILTFTPAQAQGKYAAAVNGRHSVEDAFMLLLEGTGLQAVNMAPGSYTLRSAEVEQVKLDATQIDSRHWQPGTSSSTRSVSIERQDLHSTLRSIPGTHSFHSRSQPGMMVNIRGLAGYGRVNTMIDGVTQTFRNNAGHGSGSLSAYVDPSLLAGVDIQRGAVAGAQGAGTLAGTANFRTLELDDLVRKDRQVGFRSTYRHGNNGYGNSRMFAAAAKAVPAADAVYGVVAAYSSTNQYDYRTSAGQKNPYDPAGQDQHSALLKWVMQPNEQHRLEVGSVRYQSDFYHNYPWQVRNQTTRAKYVFNPYHEWVELTANAYLNRTRLYYPRVEDSTFIGRRTRNDASGFDFTNLSRFNLGAVETRWSNGFKYYTDEFVATTRELRGANPEGEQTIESVFSTLELSYSIYALTAAMHLDRYKVQGYIPVCSVLSQCVHLGGGGIERTSRTRSFNPQVRFAVQPMEGVQGYVGWSKTTRGPRVQEMFFEKIPFPNSPSSSDGIGANPFLRNERSLNYEIGVNLWRDNWLLADDSAYLKLNRFISKIEGYITPQNFIYLDNDGDEATKITWVNWQKDVRMQGYELEAGYDAGWFYGNVSWTRASTRAPAIEYVYMEGINSLPERYWTLDLGGRAFDQRLVLGLRAEYSGPTEEPYDFFETRMSESTGVLLDLYGSWQVHDSLQVFFNVENLENKAYNYNASADSFMSPILDRGNGRGRTTSVGFKVEF